MSGSQGNQKHRADLSGRDQHQEYRIGGAPFGAPE